MVWRMLRLLPLVCLVVAGVLPALEDRFAMRWRVVCDREAGIALRIPYHYHANDPYTAAWRDVERRGYGRPLRFEPGRAVDAETLYQRLSSALRGPVQDPDLVLITADEATVAAHPGDVAFLEHLLGTAFTRVEPWDYYRSDPARPHAAAGWAPDDIRCALGVDAQRHALLVRYDNRAAVVLQRSGVDEAQRTRIFDSVEVVKSRSRRDPGETWLEANTWGDKRVLDADGQLVRPEPADEPRFWSRAWAVETPHYHVTCNVSPERTFELAGLLEGLYDAYAEVFEPERMPPIKLEVHIAFDVEDFRDLAAARGFHGIHTGEQGTLTGGFFAPAGLATFTFDRAPERMPHSAERILAHEVTHQFVHLACGGSHHVPTWINEGLAVYFESGRFTGRRFTWRPPTDRIRQLEALYRFNQGTLVPLEQYLGHHGHIPAASYGEVYAMTHFWVFASRAGRKRFGEYWRALRDGEDGNEAFERIFMHDMIRAAGGREAALRRWEEALLRYVDEGRLEASR